MDFLGTFVAFMVIVGIPSYLLFRLGQTENRDDPFDNLPPKNETLPNTAQGVYEKYYVHRVDRSDLPGGEHEHCQYYVLDLNHDPYALDALYYYAKACKITHPQLSADLKKKVEKMYEDLENRDLM